MSDTGLGMNESTLTRIFEPFFTTKGLHGTGLGLATVYGIVKQSGGEISCESAVGVGTTFRIRLPRFAGASDEPEAARPSQPVGGSETILLVDDDQAVREVLRIALQRRGYDVRTTGRPQEALQWMAGGLRPALLISDVRMAEMNGVIFARAAKGHDPSLKVILMSGDAAPTLASEDQIAGATFEQKPISPPALLRSVRARLDEG